MFVTVFNKHDVATADTQAIKLSKPSPQFAQRRRVVFKRISSRSWRSGLPRMRHNAARPICLPQRLLVYVAWVQVVLALLLNRHASEYVRLLGRRDQSAQGRLRS
jgi:hypothetical protein